MQKGLRLFKRSMRTDQSMTARNLTARDTGWGNFFTLMEVITKVSGSRTKCAVMGLYVIRWEG